MATFNSYIVKKVVVNEAGVKEGQQEVVSARISPSLKKDLEVQEHPKFKEVSLWKVSSQKESFFTHIKGFNVDGKGVLISVTSVQNGHPSDSLQWIPGVQIVMDDKGGYLA